MIVRLKKGDTVRRAYRVVDPRGFAGVLPTAVIKDGFPNAGHTVILTTPYKAPASSPSGCSTWPRPRSPTAPASR
jgi:hypothetical protein